MALVSSKIAPRPPQHLRSLPLLSCLYSTAAPGKLCDSSTPNKYSPTDPLTITYLHPPPLFKKLKPLQRLTPAAPPVPAIPPHLLPLCLERRDLLLGQEPAPGPARAAAGVVVPGLVEEGLFVVW